MSEAPTLFRDGKLYERRMGRWSRLVGEQFVDWLAPPQGLRWVDVGCGSGAFTELLIERCAPAAVTGVDPSDGQLAYARTRPGAKLAQFRIASAQDLPFENDSFDAASMALVIAFVPEPLRAATEMARVVRPGGIVATYMWDMAGGGFPLRPIAQAMKSLAIDPPVFPNNNSSGQSEMQALWQQAGLQSIETTVIRIRVAYPDFDDFWDSNVVPDGSGQVIHDLTPARRADLKARLREQLPTDAEGRIAYEAWANAVKGRVPPA